MNRLRLIDIRGAANGTCEGYGNRLEAYSFVSTDGAEWLDSFASRLCSASDQRIFFPVYRMADGEFQFLFGPRINFKRDSMRSVLRYIKYGLLGFPKRTMWGEGYSRAEAKVLRSRLADYLRTICEHGSVALYWNENGCDGYNEHNRSLQRSFKRLGITLSETNYIPFHFCAAAIAKYSSRLIQGRHILIASGIEDDERVGVSRELQRLGARKVSFWRCSRQRALAEDVETLAAQPGEIDLALVAAGIGSARIIALLAPLKCPVIDIGSYLHVLSGKSESCHSGFFLRPTLP